MDIFIDGSCPNNGKAGARAAFAWALAEDGVIIRSHSEKIPESKPQTNQYAELAAFAYAFENLPLSSVGPVTIYSDSDYAIKCISVWGPKWKAQGWRRKAGGGGGKPIEHLDIIIPLVDFMITHQLNSAITLKHIDAHQTAAKSRTYPYSGNALVDRLAREKALLD
jgi:ribonuclease HI